MPTFPGARQLIFWLVLLLLGALDASVLAQDKIFLKNGEFYQGVVLEQGEGSITFRSGRGELTLPIHLIDRVERAAREEGREPAEREATGPRSASRATRKLADGNVWFAIHDVQGRLVGTCHRIVRNEEGDDAPRIRLEEQWVLADGASRLHVHCLEFVDADFRPRSFQFRQWRDLEGTSIEGEVKGSALEITRTNAKGQPVRERLPFEREATFPMSAAFAMRRDVAEEPAERTVTLFDYRRGTFVRQNYHLGGRRPWKPGVEARVVTAFRGSVACEEWIDGAGDTVHLEVNGPHLVATPARESDLRRWIEGEEIRSLDVAGIVGGGGSFRVHVPNPTWEVVEAPLEDPGSVLLRQAQADANATFLLVPDLDDDLTPEGALLQFERRMMDLDGYERRELPRPFQQGEKRGSRLEFSYRDERGLKRDGLLYLITSDEHRLAFVASAPSGALRGFDRDLGRMLQLLRLN